MKITSLVDNVCNIVGVDSQHGLSLYIETKNLNILFDMGQNDLFLKNAKALGVDISNVDVAVISHGHYDHGGGLPYFLEANKKAPVYINKYAFGSHFNGAEKYIGLDVTLKENGRLKFVEKCENVDRGVTFSLLENNRLKYDIEPCGLKVKTGTTFCPEKFLHEQYLLIEEDGKKVLFSGCSHKGILNIAYKYKPDCLVGGFHFSKIEDEDKLKCFAGELDGYNTKYFTGHCTGVNQFKILSEHMKNIKYLACGESVLLP